jgi:hypothetical protein
MKFQVPQFVEVEDKIFWQFTLKQFIYLAGGAGISIVFYLFIKPIFLAILFIIPIIAFSLALAFYRYNNRPFIVLVEAATMYLFNSRLYIWRKVEQPVKPSEKSSPNDDTGSVFVPKLSDSKLKDLTWSLSAKEGVNSATHDTI